MRLLLIILATFLVTIPLPAVELPPAVTLVQARDNYEAAVAETKAANREARVSLFAKYEAALERLQQSFQSQSDPEKAVAVQKERSRVAREKTAGDSKISEIASLQEILRTSSIPFDKQLAGELEQLRLAQVELLTGLSTTLSSLGATREAGATLKEIARLQSPAVHTPAANSPPAQAQAPLVDPPARIIGPGNIGKGQDITISATLEPGSYNLPKRVTIKRPNRESKAAVLLYAPPGTSFRDCSFLAAVGCSLFADGARFQDSLLLADLNGILRARDSLFESCTFNKGGGWYSKAFNSKWRLENSVISGSFIPSIRSKSHGLQIRNCTFHRVNFEPFLYRDDSDAGAEAVHKERTIDACRFIDCRIPIDLLICTTNCLFEDCTFDDPGPLPLETPVSVTVYVRGGAPMYPPLGDKITLSIKPAGELPAPAGSDLRYEIKGTSLSFTNPPVATP